MDTASAACPAHPGSRDIMSMTIAAVICDADDPCSVNTAYEPESYDPAFCTFDTGVPAPNS